MPAVAAWMATAAFPTVFGAAVTYGTLIKTALVVGVGLYSRRQQKKARAAAADSITDRTFMVRSAVTTRPIVYGRTRLSGPFRPVGTHGPIGEVFSFTVSLAGPLDAVEEVWFGDTSLGTLDANGWTTTGEFYKSVLTPAVHSATVSATGTITLPHLAASFLNVSAPVGSASWSNLVAGDPVTSEDQFSVATVGGVSVLTFHSNFIGTAITVNYQYTIGDAKARAKAFLGQAGQAADPYLIAEFPTIWTADHRSDGASYLSCTLEYDPDVYPTGVPNVSAVVRGKRVYDPRTTLTAWSQNPALHTADYLVTEFGCTWDEINTTALIAAANACDEQVNLDASNTHARYTFDGALDSGTNRLQNLETILASMAGTATFSAGQWYIKAGVWEAPTLALDEDDLSGDGGIIIQAFASRRDLFNGVRGTFTDPATWQPTDFPAYTSLTYQSRDGDEEVVQDIDLPMVTNVYRAQRLAKLALFRSRQALTFSASWNLGAYEVTPGDMVEITIGRHGWADKAFRCIDRKYDPLKNIRLTFREDAEALYAWNYSEATVPDPAPNTNLPSVRTVEVPVLTFASGAAFVTVLADGSQRPFMRVYWQDFDATVERIELMWRLSHEVTFQSETIEVEQGAFDIYGVSSGETMIVQGRAVNGIGVRSEWAVYSVDIDTEAPTNFIGPGMVGTEMIAASAATSIYQYDYTGSAITVGHVSSVGSGGTDLLDRFLIDNDTDVAVTAIITGQAFLTVTGKGQGGFLAIDQQFNSNEVVIDTESPAWNWIDGYPSLYPMTSIAASETIGASMVVTSSYELSAGETIGITLVAAVADADGAASFTSANASRQSLRIEIVKR